MIEVRMTLSILKVVSREEKLHPPLRPVSLIALNPPNHVAVAGYDKVNYIPSPTQALASHRNPPFDTIPTSNLAVSGLPYGRMKSTGALISMSSHVLERERESLRTLPSEVCRG